VLRLIVSRRAALDLAEIETYSHEQWGKRVAAEYLQSIEQALSLLRERPGILARRAGVSPHFHFYPVRQHLLVFDVTENILHLLAVRHGGMDLPERLAELEPYLLEEIAVLHKKLVEK
jgi:plasmid stabilization system protein ParE